ncbi:MAG: protein-L-isoaspartate O-methyltransferase [Mariprofundaceae bacterium]
MSETATRSRNDDRMDWRAARRNMVEYQIRCCKVLDPDVLDLIESMPREAFTPEHVRTLAYMEGHVPLPCGQEMLSPLQEAHILQSLRLKGDERVLEIGTGTGFLTAMLAMRAREVVSCEIHQELAEMARRNLKAHGVDNARVLHLNAMDPDALQAEVEGPFDAVVVGAAVKEIPPHLEAMVTDGGQMIAFVGENPVVSLVHRRKLGQTWIDTPIFETLLLSAEGLPEKREFVF